MFGLLALIELLENRSLLKEACRLKKVIGVQFIDEECYVVLRVRKVNLTTFSYDYLMYDEVTWKSSESMAIGNIHCIVFESLDRARGRLAYQFGEGAAYEESMAPMSFMDMEDFE